MPSPKSKTAKPSKSAKPSVPTGPAAKRSPEKNYHHGNLRAALVNAALTIIEEKGSRDLTLREVARRAGVSHTAPYRHFDYKEAMLAAVAVQGFNALCKAMEERSAKAESPVARFQEAGIAYIIFAIEHAAHYRLMFGPELAGRLEFPELSQASKAAFSVMEDSLAECQRQGLIQAGAVRDFALVAWSMVHGFAMLVVDGQFKNKGYSISKLDDLMKAATRVLVQGLHRS